MGEKNDNGGKGKNGKEKQSSTVVLKVDLHCEGCASKIVKVLCGFEGVESVKTEPSANKVTVVGAVDPAVLREKLNLKMKKQVDLISPQPKKNTDNSEKEKKPENKKNPDDDKKKKTPATTVVLKLQLHCQGCIDKIRKTISKTKGYHEMSIDEQKDQVTVKGTMDVKALTEALKEKLKRRVEIVQPKKEDDGKGGGGGGKNKNKGNGGGGDGGKEDGHNNGGVRLEGGRLEHMVQPGFGYGHPFGQGYWVGYPAYAPGHGFPAYAPGPVYQVLLPAPQIFSDENPNACSIL
ncbi:hypothetical protein SLA2020_521920 [Shorea laevis]